MTGASVQTGGTLNARLDFHNRVTATGHSGGRERPFLMMRLAARGRFFAFNVRFEPALGTPGRSPGSQVSRSPACPAPFSRATAGPAVRAACVGTWKSGILKTCLAALPGTGMGALMGCVGERGGEAQRCGTTIGVVPSILRVGRSLTGETRWEAFLRDCPHLFFYAPDAPSASITAPRECPRPTHQCHGLGR